MRLLRGPARLMNGLMIADQQHPRRTRGIRPWEEFFAHDPMARGALAVMLVFVALTAALWRFRDLPYYWDALGYVFSHSAQIHDTNLFPILTTWDVGHPTLFFFVVAVFMKLFSVGPLAGHLATWLFTALLIVAIHGCGRALELPRSISAATALVVFLFPLTFAASLQITLDLPLTALTMAAVWFWARGRWLGYFIVGSMTTLVKLYGFFIVPALLFALMILHGMQRPRDWRSFWRDCVRTVSPLITLIIFFIVRYQVRGPGLTIAWESGNKPVPIWDWPAFTAYFPRAFDDIFTASMLDRFLVFAVILFFLLVACRSLGVVAPSVISRASARVLAASLGISLIYSMAFFQSLSLCARYNLPTVCGIFLIISFCLWNLLGNQRILLLLHAMAGVLFIILWHPRNAEALPAPLSTLLRRPVETLGYRMENDLRFLDVIDLTKWAGREINAHAKRNHKARGVSTNWPFSIALADARFGYLDRRLNIHVASLWSEVEGSRHPYVLIINPISNFYDPPPPPNNPYVASEIASRVKGEVQAHIYLVRRNKSAPSPAK